MEGNLKEETGRVSVGEREGSSSGKDKSKKWERREAFFFVDI